MTRVAVCLPTFDEAENVGAMLDAVLGVFDEHGIDGRILVIDDASPDGTAEIVDERARKDPRISVLRRARREGLGLAYRDGFRHVLDEG
ncbi:MAG TPA: glycosyltransferase, partial [Gaiellaceae bacterium]